MFSSFFEALLSAVLNFIRQLISDNKATTAQHDLGVMEQIAKDAVESSNEITIQAEKANEIGEITTRPIDRIYNRNRLHDGSA